MNFAIWTQFLAMFAFSQDIIYSKNLNILWLLFLLVNTSPIEWSTSFDHPTSREQALIYLEENEDRSVIPFLPDLFNLTEGEVQQRLLDIASGYGWVVDEAISGQLFDQLKSNGYASQFAVDLIIAFYNNGYWEQNPQKLGLLVQNGNLDSHVRCKAIELAAMLPQQNRELTNSLKQILDDVVLPADLRAQAAESLGKIDGRRLTAFLIQRLPDEVEPAVVIGILEGLAAVQHPLSAQAVYIIVDIMYRNENSDIKSAAVQALRESGNFLAAQYLYSYYQGLLNTNLYLPSMRLSVAEALIAACSYAQSDEEKEEATSYLLRILENSYNGPITRNARDMMLQLGEAGLPLMRIALDSSNRVVRLNTLYVIGRLRDKQSLSIVVQIYVSTHDPVEKKLAQQAYQFIRQATG